MDLKRLSSSRNWLAGILAALVLAGGCASKEGKIPADAVGAPDKFLFSKGTELLNQKHWARSREYFRQLVDNYPQSLYRPDARLGLGDTYLGEQTTESLVLAINEYREFLTYYPTSRRADYAQLKLAYAHYAQMLAPQRDQAQTKEAVKEFQTFVERYPQSPHMADARQKLRECRDRLDDADYFVGVFYYRTKWYMGAAMRFKGVLQNDPEYSRRDALYYYLAASYTAMLNKGEALPVLDKLAKEFPKSEYTEQAADLTAELQNPSFGQTAKKANAKGTEQAVGADTDATPKDATREVAKDVRHNHGHPWWKVWRARFWKRLATPPWKWF